MADEISEMLVKVKGDISDLLAKYEAGKRGTKDFEDTVDKSSTSMSRSFKDVDKSVDDLGKTTKSAGSDAERSLTGWRGKADDLKNAFTNLDTKFRSIAPSFGKSGAASGSSFMTSLAESIPAWIPLVAAAAIPVGAMVGAAITTGLGLAGIGAGIAAAFQDPRIKAGAHGLVNELKADFTKIGAPFIQPLITALSDLRAKAANLNLSAVFAPLAGEVVPLEQGLVGLAKSALPGIRSAFANAAPIVREFASELPSMGKAIGDLFNAISRDKGAVMIGLQAFMGTVNFVIEGVGQVIRFAEDSFAGLSIAFADTVKGIIDGAEDMTSWIPGWGDKIKQARTATDAWATALVQTATTGQTSNHILVSSQSANTTSVNTLKGAYQRLYTQMTSNFNQAMSLDQATLSVKQAQADLATSLKTNGKHWDENTQAGRNNWNQLLQSIQADKNAYDAQVAVGGATAGASAKYHSQVDKLLALAKQAGLTKGQIALLKQEYESIPPAKSLTITVHTRFAPAGGGKPGGSSNLVPIGPFGANSGVWPGGMIRGAYANSGIAIPHFDVSGVYPGVPGGMYRMAESSTREEALIARNGDRNRALSSLRTAADWFGADVTVNRGISTGVNYAAAGAGGGAVFPLYASIEIDGKTVVRALTPAAQKRGARNGGVTGLG